MKFALPRWRAIAAGLMAALLAALAACSWTMPLPPSTGTQSGFAPHFKLSGRISVRVNDKIDSGQIRWSRNAREERVGIYSPLGSQLGELLNETGAGSVSLQQGKEITRAASVEALTESLLGVPLDLARLSQWVQGVDMAENLPTAMTMGNGRQWQVTAEKFQVRGNHRFASRLIASSGDTVVRLVIDEWAAE